MTLQDFTNMARMVKDFDDTWPSDYARDWLIWANEHGFLLTVSEDTERVIGLMVARPVSQPPSQDFSDEFDEDGNFVHIDLCLAPTKNIWRGLHYLMINRFNKQGFISARSIWRPGGLPKVHNTKKVTKALLKKE